ncbi:hypothetical protein GCM10022276_12570 [Sphingomonas limnosediminicola]|uniref:CHRD domain-containing protein n=1 Tax=Sphingomonas limnosediminicola TaxID=940133 RepID=A0ABP7L8K8_9SPHN
MAKLLMLVAAGLALFATPAAGATNFIASLTTGQETAPITPSQTDGSPRPQAFGNGTFTLNDAETALVYSLTVFNIDFTGTQTADINDNLVAAHVHVGPTAMPGSNAPVVFGFLGSPFNDNNPNDVVISPFGSGVGGTISGKWDSPEGNNTTLAAQIANLLAGLSYVNFHTVQYPGGEIRGALAPQAVPEANTWAMMMFGFVVLGAAVRHNRKQSPFAIGRQPHPHP